MSDGFWSDMDYTRPGPAIPDGHLLVAAKDEDGKWHFAVADNGVKPLMDVQLSETFVKSLRIRYWAIIPTPREEVLREF